jgi:Flp pilus assembly protein TadG
MAIKTSLHKRKNSGYRAQALVEFAIAMPVLIVMLVGIMEAGRMVLTYALVVNASRDAVRYASAYGRSDDGYIKYENCAGINSVAVKSALIIPVTVTITYDSGPGTSSIGTCTPLTSTNANIPADTGSRVTVTVQASYKPVIKLIPLGNRTFTSESSRTILGIYDLPNP